MKKYTVIDINSNKHIVYADDVSTTPEGDHVAIKFWRLSVSGHECCSFFNFDNVICITEDSVNTVEILESEVEDVNLVEPESDGGKHAGCSTCKHKDKVITDEPCMDCWYNSKWEAKNENN